MLQLVINKNIRMKAAKLILIVTLLFFNSCGTKDKTTTTRENVFFKVNIDGVEHSFNKSVFVNASSLKVGLIAISPDDGNGKRMAIALTSKDAEVTGTFTKGFIAVFHQDGVAGAWDADGNTRTITITKNNDTFIEGTFSFTGDNLKDETIKEFTQGSFRAKKP